jgi:peptidoglycan/LPS O-acetylase OafA/YrhL
MSEHAIPIQRKHLPALDAVRGVAILCVFLYHMLSAAWGRDQLEWGRIFRQWPADRTGMLWFYPMTYGWLGVSLFFVLSGFVIHYSTITARQPFSTLNFYSRRFWRIYPPYAVALLTFCIFRLNAESVTRLAVVTHVLLLQDFSRSTFFLINPSFWSIATEIQFYLVYPLLIFARRSAGMFNVLMGVLTFSLLARVAICFAERHHSDAFSDFHYMLWVAPLITIFDWTLGAYLAECFANGKRIFPRSAGVMLITAVALVASSFIRPLSIFSFQLGSVLSAIWIERVIWSTKPMNVLQKLLIPLGLCSYSFYLFHQPLLDKLVSFSERFTTNRYVMTLGFGPLIFCILFAVSWIIYLTVEKTSIHLGKRFSFKPKAVDVVNADVVQTNPPVIPAMV